MQWYSLQGVILVSAVVLCREKNIPPLLADLIWFWFFHTKMSKVNLILKWKLTWVKYKAAFKWFPSLCVKTLWRSNCTSLLHYDKTALISQAKPRPHYYQTCRIRSILGWNLKHYRIMVKNIVLKTDLLV